MYIFKNPESLWPCWNHIEGIIKTGIWFSQKYTLLLEQPGNSNICLNPIKEARNKLII